MIDNEWPVAQETVARAIEKKIDAPDGCSRRGAAHTVLTSVRRKLAALARRHNDYGAPVVIKMSLAEWLSVPDSLIQRDTERHWNSRKGDLSILVREHLDVQMTVTLDGCVQKSNGNTRSYAWENNLTDQLPESLNVSVLFVRNQNEANASYKRHDNVGQGKTGSHQLFSACREVGLNVHSTYLARCDGIVTALREAFKDVANHGEIGPTILKRATTTPMGNKKPPDILECVRFFKPALQALDSLNATSTRFRGAVTRAFLLGYTKYVTMGFGDELGGKEKFMELFRQYRDDAGCKDGGQFDAVENINIVQFDHQLQGSLTKRNTQTLRILGAIERWMENRPTRLWRIHGSVDMQIYFTNRTALTKGNGGRKNKPDDDTDL